MGPSSSMAALLPLPSLSLERQSSSYFAFVEEAILVHGRDFSVSRVTGVTRGGGVEGHKEEKKEKEKEGKEEKKEEKFLHRADPPIKGSTRGPRGPKDIWS